MATATESAAAPAESKPATNGSSSAEPTVAKQNGHAEPERRPRSRSGSPDDRSRSRDGSRSPAQRSPRDRSPPRERSPASKREDSPRKRDSPPRRDRSHSPRSSHHSRSPTSRRDRSPSSRDRRDSSPGHRSRDREHSHSRSPRRSERDYSPRDKDSRDYKSSSSSRSRHSRDSDDDRHRSSRDSRDYRDRDDRGSSRRDDRDDRRRSPPRSSAATSSSSSNGRSTQPTQSTYGVVSGSLPYSAPSVGYGASSAYGTWPPTVASAAASAAGRNAPVQKNFYKPPPSHANFTDDQVHDWWRENRIALQGRDAGQYKPCRTFDESNLAPDYLITTRNFAKPTPIQAQTWPIALSGRDMIGIAETGSGKTLAFVVPGCVHIRAQAPISPVMPGPIVLILAPTRELACQTQEVCDAVGRGLGIRTVCLYGGVGKGSQRGALQRGVHIAVATPGRLLDLINEGRCNINRVTYLVLDEADRMLDMGFEKDIRAIIERLRRDRQTLMFSATWPVEIQRLAHEFLQDPIKVTIGSPDLAANRKITQVVEVVQNPDDRDDRLDACLRKYHASGQNRILIFVGMKREADRVDRMLRNRYRWRSQAIHGDLDQNERTRVLAQFKSGTSPLLVATDVAARGLDIPDVEYVINYTFPMNIEDYVHRIGRTGRGGKEGLAHTFFTPTDSGKARDLIDILRKANQHVPRELEEMNTYGKRRGGGGRSGGGGARWGGGGGGHSGGHGGHGGGAHTAHGGGPGYGAQGGYRGPTGGVGAPAAAPVVPAAAAGYGAPGAMPWAAYGQFAYTTPAQYAMPYGMPYGMSPAAAAPAPVSSARK